MQADEAEEETKGENDEVAQQREAENYVAALMLEINPAPQVEETKHLYCTEISRKLIQAL